MCNIDATEYRGNFIFRNQPNHSYFDKPFDDEQDCLFQLLNEIDPNFLTPQQKAESINLSNTMITDPRTRKPVTKLCYNYTKEEKTKIFHCPKTSLMNKAQHELGIRVLKLLQECQEVEEEDLYNWYRMQKVRSKENLYFQKFASEFSKNNKALIYAPCRKLLELYKNWYIRKVIRIKKRYLHETYNTHLGLPNVEQCKNALSNEQIKIADQEIIGECGERCCWQDTIKEEFKKFNCCINSYAALYRNSEIIKESLENNLKLQFLNIVEKKAELPSFYIPLESLLFLLTAGNYVDMPSEMLLNIKETDRLKSNFNKYIVMDLPLPSRQCGWHSYNHVVEQAAMAMLSIKQMKYVEDKNLKNNFCTNNSSDFQVFTLQEFMIRTRVTEDKLCKFAKTLIKWQLASSEDDMDLQIYTSLDSTIENKSVAFKLEYKSKLGCEVLTKYEILKEWFKLKLSGAPETSIVRLDASNYQTMVEETLNIRQLEERLSSIYKINCNQMINNLYEFLNLLYKTPPGPYMCRYNPKFKDKFMLCRPSQEITLNTIYLHKMLDGSVTDVEFMLKDYYLPIDENICSIMHFQHKILPATFSPSTISETRCDNKIQFGSKQSNRAVPLKKFDKPLKKVDKPLKKFDGKQFVNKTRRKRINRKKRQYNATKSNINELKELEREIEMDRKMVLF